MPWSYSIVVASQKGGVGKTSVAVNLASVLSGAGYKTMLVDTDTVNPSVGIHLGIEGKSKGCSDLFGGKAKLHEATVRHLHSGLTVIPGAMSMTHEAPSGSGMEDATEEMLNQGYDFVVFDTSPGSTLLDSIYRVNYGMIVMSPDMPSFASSIRLDAAFGMMKIPHGLVINRVRKKRYELGMNEIEHEYGGKVLGMLRDDDSVPIGIARHVPACLLDRDSHFSKGVRSLAAACAANAGMRAGAIDAPKSNISLIKRLLGRSR